MNHGKRAALTAVGAAAGFGLVALAIGGRWGSVENALVSTSLWTLLAASLLQLGSLLARSEAWHRCVHAAGGTVSRRVLFRAASVGYVGNLVNGEIGFAMRIAALKRSAPDTTPKLGALATTEVPILLTELVLAVAVSVTLVGPLGWHGGFRWSCWRSWWASPSPSAAWDWAAGCAAGSRGWQCCGTAGRAGGWRASSCWR